MFERVHVWVKFSQILLGGHQHQRKHYVKFGLMFPLCSCFTSVLSNTKLAADPHTKQHLILWVSKLEFYFYSGVCALRRWCWLDGMLIVCFPNVHSGEQLWILFTDWLNKWIRGRSLISLMIVLLKRLCKELAVDSNDRGCSQIMASPASSYLVSPWSLIYFSEAFIFFV